MEKTKILQQKIENKKAQVGVIGLGYVGLPLAVLFAKKGFHVTGFVRNNTKKENLEKGISNLSDAKVDNDLQSVIQNGLLKIQLITADVLEAQDIYIICVPT